jgi:hypothetical protein
VQTVGATEGVDCSSESSLFDKAKEFANSEQGKKVISEFETKFGGGESPPPRGVLRSVLGREADETSCFGARVQRRELPDLCRRLRASWVEQVS